MADSPQAAPRRSSGHVHTNRCYWDLNECRWVCRPAREPDPAYDAASGNSLTAVNA